MDIVTLMLQSYPLRRCKQTPKTPLQRTSLSLGVWSGLGMFKNTWMFCSSEFRLHSLDSEKNLTNRDGRLPVLIRSRGVRGGPVSDWGGSKIELFGYKGGSGNGEKLTPDFFIKKNPGFFLLPSSNQNNSCKNGVNTYGYISHI